MENSRDSIEQIVDAYHEGNISRRAFMQRALALGLGMSTISALLASQGVEVSKAATAVLERGLPKVGGTLREGYDLDVSRIDSINSPWADPSFQAVYESLVTKDPSGKIVPMLAESWSFSKDGLTVTFKLRKGLKFHGGRPLTAQAIKEDFDTVADPKAGSALRILWVPAVKKTLAPDDTTVVIKLSHPYFDILNVVGSLYWNIANMQTRKKLGTNYAKKVVDGSGPFTLAQWVPGSHALVKRWEGYPGSIVPYYQNKGKAYLDGIRWSVMLEAAQRATQIETGEIDTLIGPAYSDVARLKKNKDLIVTEVKEWSGYYLGANFKSTDLGFDDLRVRRAISHAINRKAIADKLFFGGAEPMYGPITSADKSYTKKVEKYNQFDLAKAKALMAEAGWKPGSNGILEKSGKKMQFDLVLQAESTHQQLGSVIQAQLRELGMDVKAQVFDRGTFFGKLGGADLFLNFYLWSSPIDVIILFIDSSLADGKGANFQNAKIPELDAAIARYQRTSNSEKQLLANAAKLQVLSAELLPFIPLVNRKAFWVRRKNVHGYLVHQFNLYPYYNDVWLS